MKANKFPGNVMKEAGIKSWCQLGVVTVGALILLVMGLHGWSFDWDGPLPGTGWIVVWNFFCAVIAMFAIVVAGVVGALGIGMGCYHGAINGWKWARDNCEQITYEDDDDVE